MTMIVGGVIFFFMLIFEFKLKDRWFYFFLIAGLLLLFLFQNQYSSFFNFLNVSIWKWVINTILLGLLLGIYAIENDYNFEVSALTILLAFGALLVIVSDHLIITYLAIELQTFCVFVLIARNKIFLKGAEAALKYFILGAVSSGLLLLGISILLYDSGSLFITDLRLSWLAESILPQLGILLIVLALLFKLAVAPLHFWVSDVYEGSSWATIGIISTISKLSIVVVLQQIGFQSVILVGIIALSLVVGTFGALNQTKLKRLLGYSGINHMAFVLVGFLILDIYGYESTYIYLIIYFGLTLGILGLSYSVHFSKELYLVQLGFYYNSSRVLAFSWAVLLLSIAGVPPLSGFFGKWIIINLLIDNGYLGVVCTALITSVISVGYYLRIVKINYFQKCSSYLIWERILCYKKENNLASIILIGGNVYLALFLVLNPQAIMIPFFISYCLI